MTEGELSRLLLMGLILLFAEYEFDCALSDDSKAVEFYTQGKKYRIEFTIKEVVNE